MDQLVLADHHLLDELAGAQLDLLFGGGGEWRCVGEA
jgi:hypothetical protein